MGAKRSGSAIPSWWGACMLAAAGAVPGASLAAPAARVEFAIGDVQIVASGGQVRPARKGAEVNSGEILSTNRGRAQLRFTDGAYMSLQPQSEFRIDDYRFEGQADGSERGFFSLLKGGLRTITGVVGRSNKHNYRVSTAVATIGIRGTEYTVAYTSSITGSVGEGEIEVCTIRCVPFGSGQSFFVPDAESLPQLVTKKADLPPAQPNENRPRLAVGDEKKPDGTPRGLLLTGTQQLDGVAVFGGGSLSFPPGTAAFDSSGVLTQLAGIVPAGPVVQTGNDGIMAWGYFPKQDPVGRQTLAFVTGLPVDNPNALAKKVATYGLMRNGATPVIDPSTGMSIGTLTGATMTVNFSASQATAQMAWTIQEVDYVVGLNSSVFSNRVFHLNSPCPGEVCSVTVTALAQVYARNAARAGIAYEFLSGKINGVGSAALMRTGLTPSKQPRAVVTVGQ